MGNTAGRARLLSVLGALVGVLGVAFVVPHAGDALTAVDLADWCRERLAGFKVPKRFEVVAEIPLLPIGKVDKPALRALARSAG